MALPPVRVIDDGELRAWIHVASRAMLGSPPDDETIERRRATTDLDRCHAAFDERGVLSGTAAAYTTELTVPGGVVPAAAVTAVGVLPTQRRRGHLGRLMQAQMADMADRGEAVAVLVAAEHPIYGRYGYGPATEACGIRIDKVSLDGRPNGGWKAPPTGQSELVDNEAFADALRDVYGRARLRSPGHLSWRDQDYQAVAGKVPPSFGPDSRTWPKVLWRDGRGRVQGGVVYDVEDRWDHNRPRGKLSAAPLVAVTDEAQRELVRYLTSVDWVGTVEIGLRPVDDPTPLWLQDGRTAVAVDRSDHVWARIMDVPAALSARRYQAPGRLVLQVDDTMGFAAGRFALDVDAGSDAPGAAGDPGGPADGHAAALAGRCTPTGAEPDLTVPAGALGAAYLGGTSWARLAAAGQVDEHRNGAVARASAMFSTPRAPWCAVTF